MYAQPSNYRGSSGSYASKYSMSSSASDSSAHWSWQTPRDASDVGTSVRNLLIATKQLQDALEQWSVGRVTESQVSDVFVLIGTEFNMTVRAFSHFRIDLSDIHSIPGDLRTVLEQCLAEDPSPDVLRVYMPDVRAVLARLLRGLQARQEQWRVVCGGSMGLRES